MSTRQPIILFLLSLLLTSVGCAEGDTDRTAGDTDAGPVDGIAVLQERPPGLDNGDFAKISASYDAAIATLAQDPQNVESLVTLAGLFAYEARVTGDHPYYYPAGLAAVDAALAIDANNYEAVLTKASILLSLHRFSDALTYAEKAQSLAPNAAAPYGALVDAHVELGNLEKAVEAGDRMVAIRPDLKSYARISYLRELHGDDVGATEAMRLAVNAGNPGSEEKAWARTTLGGIYRSRGLLDSAEREYLLTIAERKDYPFALAGYAHVMYEMENRDSAHVLLDRAINLMPEFSFVEMQADIARVEGDDARADSLVAVITTMLAEDEASGHSMNLELSRLHAAHATDLAEATRRARVELEGRAGNPDALDALAFALYRAGQLDEASTMIEQALAAAPKNGVILAHAGLIDIARGETAQGKERIAEARRMQKVMPILLAHHVATVTG